MKLKPFSSHTGLVLPLDISNVDTDLIIPKQYLKSIKKVGFGPYLFDELRYLDSAEYGDDCTKRKLNTNFILNKEEYKGSSVLLARENFGCGSSREHAAWAIYDYGFRVVISSFFADIFKNNALNNGLLVFELDENLIQKIFKKISNESNIEFETDLNEQKFYSLYGSIDEKFQINDYNKTCLLKGYDNVDYLLSIKEKILKFENETGR